MRGVPAARAAVLRPEVRLAKDEAFEVCAALALAEAVLAEAGRAAEAAYLGRVFAVVEDRLAG